MSVERLDSSHTLDEFLAASSGGPVLVFKHSRTCGVSAQAFDELRSYLDSAASAPRVGIVVVQSHRELSTELARRLAIRHETPQLLLIRDGRAVWHASHYRVRTESIAAAVQAQVATGSASPSSRITGS